MKKYIIEVDSEDKEKINYFKKLLAKNIHIIVPMGWVKITEIEE